MHSTFYVIHPRGDTSKLQILEMQESLSYELDDYALASHESFMDEDQVLIYAKYLASSRQLSLYDKEGRLLTTLNDHSPSCPGW